MVNTLRALWDDESGQGLPEYALLVAAVVVMVVAAATLFSDEVSGLFESVGTYINDKNAIATEAAGGGSAD